MTTGDLASLNDVAVQLGYDSADDMSTGERGRAAVLISKISDLFAEEAQRSFAPGVETVRLRVQYRSPYECNYSAFVRTSETPTTVTEVKDDTGHVFDTADYVINPVTAEISLLRLGDPNREREFSQRGGTPYFVTVTYTHDDPIPPAVVGTVAEVVARYMSLSGSTGSSFPAITSMSDALGNRVTFADWVSRTVQLTPEDLRVAYRFRPVQPSMVVGT